MEGKPRLARCMAVVAVVIALFLPSCVGTATAARATTDSTVGHGLLQRIVDEVPTYQPGTVHWRLSLSADHWGQTNWNTKTITISILVPLNYLYSVVVHEWSHELSVFDYGGDIWAAIHALNRTFGGGGKSGLHGTEIAADCMAILQGATWTKYTHCHRMAWRHAARRLVDGHRI